MVNDGVVGVTPETRVTNTVTSPVQDVTNVTVQDTLRTTDN